MVKRKEEEPQGLCVAHRYRRTRLTVFGKE
jgi:hypothetical protein